MIHRKIVEIDGKPFIKLEEADLVTLGVAVDGMVSVDTVETTPVERGKAFVERYIKTFEALAK
jgi:hypothetical protein